ncbi:hypothetical protein GOBAR_DD06970 [Gossypium barbadense]|nr:hypothetical protein GOBAR_DD06970 [Gossypium barbadense]
MEPIVSRYCFLFFSIFISLLSLIPLVRSGDAEALLTLKSSVDPFNSLPWKGTNVCAWEGIKECMNGTVTKLVLEHLSLSGPLDEQSLNQLDQLRVLSFKNNSLSGQIPDLSGLLNLKSLYLNDNNFTGEFPESITSLHRLKIIVLSGNQITGQIPASLLKLKRLYTLYLQDNSFNGTLPALNQTSLRFFNVSNNQLHGQIPVTPALVRFNLSSFSGNIDLCGEQIGIELDCIWDLIWVFIVFFTLYNPEILVLFLDYLVGTRTCGGGKPLHWTSCLKIAEDLATGLLYIHQNPGLTHGNLKSSNVLLGPDFESCLTDYGLTIFRDPDSVEEPGAATFFYRAPECRDIRKSSTQPADVYSLGVLLLELLTGKTPFQDLVQEHGSDIPRWVKSVREEETESGDDPNSGNEASEGKLQALLNIAMACVAIAPDNRPAMREVLKMIRDVRAEAQVSSNSSDHSPGRWSDTVQSLPREEHLSI